ncbi:hypothetical protein ACFX15_005437 [Malus domestica]|uniref:Uncharacterized protein n=1 Tax=Malus domestica TaxID=3750 RepID=A0A498INN4_MALDO|nr:hypothetical protein DVH24_041916 [Malus domestica]
MSVPRLQPSLHDRTTSTPRASTFTARSHDLRPRPRHPGLQPSPHDRGAQPGPPQQGVHGRRVSEDMKTKWPVAFTIVRSRSSTRTRYCEWST